MSDDTASGLDDLRGLTNVIGLILDVKVCSKRAEELIGLTIAAQEARAAAEKAQASLAGAKAEHDAHCAAREAEAEQKTAHAAGRIAMAERIEAKVAAGRRELREREDRLKRDAMRAAGVLPFFNDKMQDLPSVTQTIDDYLASRRDAEDIDVREPGGHDAEIAAPTALPAEPSARAASRGAERRVSP